MIFGHIKFKITAEHDQVGVLQIGRVVIPTLVLFWGTILLALALMPIFGFMGLWAEYGFTVLGIAGLWVLVGIVCLVSYMVRVTLRANGHY